VSGTRREKGSSVAISRAIFASAAATSADLVVLLGLAAAGVMPGPAAALACLVGGVTGFLLARRWVFRAGAGSVLRQAFLYGVLNVAGSAVLTGVAVQLAVVTLGAPLVVAKGATAILVFLAWNYPVSATIVFPRARGELS
jgi:putative flippase GtrA